ncbi:MAG: hypothetical protein EBT03_07205 [Betaproteobacteria bacterium]|nr:hypothetical protein [Betaproteobacteria bacterium]
MVAQPQALRFILARALVVACLSTAKIGSNAVVVKAVPAGVTVVGIPARVVTEDQADSLSRQKEGDAFVAYGVLTGAEDPLDVMLHQMRDELARQKEEIAALQKALAQAKSGS